MTIASDIQKLDPGARVEMFVLDATSLGDTIYRFHAGVNELGNDLVWQGETYLRFPVEASGFEKRGKGTTPRPTLKVGNVFGVISGLVKQLDDLVGAKVTRKRTMVKYLDAVNFPGGVNPTADPNSHYDDEVYYIDRKAGSNRLMVEWELASALDLAGVMIPRRQVVQNVCNWRYRSAECGYAGGPVADVNDNPVGTLALDVCGKRLGSCRLRFGENSPLPYGGFPSAGLIR